MKIIAEKLWSYVLFDDNKCWILTLLLGGVDEVDVSIKLTEEQVQLIREDIATVEKIVEAVKENRRAYSAQEIRPPVWPKKS